MTNIDMSSTVLEFHIENLKKLRDQLEVRKKDILETQGSGQTISQIEKTHLLVKEIEAAFLELLAATITVLENAKLFEATDNKIGTDIWNYRWNKYGGGM